eukprot:Opistho-2@4920
MSQSPQPPQSTSAVDMPRPASVAPTADVPSQHGLTGNLRDQIYDQRHSDRDSSNSKLMVIYTGGTVGMKLADGALKPEKGFLTQQLKELPDFNSPDMPKFDVHEWDPLLDSSDMSTSDWQRLALEIEQHYYDYDGFVVLHGTDTMAYTACALSFMLEHLGKPVIITGATIPFVEVYNDARRNVIVSMLYASRFDIPEVCIFFNNSLLRGNRSSKFDTFGLGAFESNNFPLLGTLGTEIMLRSDILLPQPRKRFRIHTAFNGNVAVLRLTPGFSDDIVRNLLLPPIQGLVMETYGVGNVPSKKEAFIAVLADAIKRGVVIVVISQCNRGFVDLNKYATGHGLRDIGVVSGGDMTAEAAATKLAYLLGKGLPVSEVKRYLSMNLRGELSPQHIDFARTTFKTQA